jgi:hypothetical protein
MIVLAVYQGLLLLGYANAVYEIYDPEKIKKKRVFNYKPLYFNTANIISFIIVLTIFFLVYDYCSNNFDIDLQEEYKDYNEKDLIFGKMNICQYAIQKYIIDVLQFKYQTISYLVYIILTIVLLVLLYFTGLLESIALRIYYYILETFDLNKLFFRQGYIENIRKLYECRGPLGRTTLDFIYDNLFF